MVPLIITFEVIPVINFIFIIGRSSLGAKDSHKKVPFKRAFTVSLGI
jgi:hypothetical protein